MLTSLAIIFLGGLIMGSIFKKIKLPPLLGMIIMGIIIGPHTLNLVDDSIITISADLRQIALIIILTRAGLSLNMEDLKKVGRPAILMCFVPAVFEIIGTMFIATKVFDISVIDSLIMGSILAAVSPAVVVPLMIKIMDEGYGNDKSIPQLLLAGSSVDDVFVIVLFTAFTSLSTGKNVSGWEFLKIPVSIILGILLGFLVGYLLIILFKKVHMRDSAKIVIILSISFLLCEAENSLKDIVPVSGLLAIMSMGLIIKKKYEILAVRLSKKYNKLWVAAEVMLFVLVGVAVDTKYLMDAGIMALIVIVVALLFRTLGVYASLIKTKLNNKEKLFCAFAYMPKATVQAAIGTIPLTMGVKGGEIILVVAVLSILTTAPVGALLTEHSYKKLLNGPSKTGYTAKSN